MVLLSIFFLVTITNAEIIFVNVVHRHGDRTPEKVYPTDPYQASYWPEGLGILTNFGKNQLYDLGKFMRDRYSDFLPIKYHDADVHVVASEKSRTLMSAYCSLASLYEPHGDDIWSTHVNHWQPVPVYVLPKSQDNKINNVVTCPRLEQLREEIYQTRVTEEKKKEYQYVAKQVSYYTGLDIKTDFKSLDKLTDVYLTLDVEDYYNLKLPNWTTDFYPEPLWEITNLLHYKLEYYDNNTKRLRCGPLLKEMIQHLDEKINGTLQEKWWHYSGHDTTVADVLNCLNVYDGDRPTYASAVFLELHQISDNSYYVAVIYKKDSTTVRYLTIPNCTFLCPLDEFKEIVKDVIPSDWDEECKSV